MSANTNSVFHRLSTRKQYHQPQHPVDQLIEALCIVGNYYESANGTAEAAGTNLVDRFVGMLVAAGLDANSLQVQAIKQRLNSDRATLGA